jgi:hypothetical protein
MKALYWTVYIVALFALGYLIAHVTRPKPKNRARKPAVHSMHLDLDFTQFESKK